THSDAASANAPRGRARRCVRHAARLGPCAYSPRLCCERAPRHRVKLGRMMDMHPGQFNAFNLGDLTDRSGNLNAPALIDCLDWERPVHYSHRDMDRLAASVASGLQRRGLEAGSRVGILSANRAEFLAAYFGIMRAGLVAVPI